MRQKPSYYIGKYMDRFGQGQVIQAMAANESAEQKRAIYAEHGFHIYLDLRLALEISAAEDHEGASRYVGVLRQTVQAVEACAIHAQVALLEVQTDKLHMFLRTAESVPTEESIRKVFTFCTALAQTIENQIRPQDPDAWKGFAMAADFGQSVLIEPVWNSRFSIISLGDSANAPAKRLQSTGAVPHGRLAYDASWTKPTKERNSRNWQEINLLTENERKPVYLAEDLVQAFNAKTAEFLQAKAPKDKVGFVQARQFVDTFQAGRFNLPSRVQAFFLRADLDGFTKRVREAFEKGEQAVLDLVAEFCEIMDLPAEFIRRLEAQGISVIHLAWAGDCANMVVFPPAGRAYGDSRSATPANISLTWHEAATRPNAKWAVAVAGGGEKEGNGMIAMVPLQAVGKTFNIAAGWSVGRSLDAQQAASMGAEVSILHEDDWSKLDNPFRDAYSGLNTFRHASLAALKKAAEKIRGQLKSATVSVVTPGISRPAPQPAPYYDPRRKPTFGR